MKKDNLTWQDCDVRLLEALLLATGEEGGASLQDVLLMGDALDGSIFSVEELEQGLEKLISTDFVAVQKNKLYLTPEFLKEYEQVTLAAGVEADANKLLENLLQQKEIAPQKVNEVRTTVLKKYKLKNYYQQYLEQFG